MRPQYWQHEAKRHQTDTGIGDESCQGRQTPSPIICRRRFSRFSSAGDLAATIVGTVTAVFRLRPLARHRFGSAVSGMAMFPRIMAGEMSRR